MLMLDAETILYFSFDHSLANSAGWHTHTHTQGTLPTFPYNRAIAIKALVMM